MGKRPYQLFFAENPKTSQYRLLYYTKTRWDEHAASYRIPKSKLYAEQMIKNNYRIPAMGSTRHHESGACVFNHHPKTNRGDPTQTYHGLVINVEQWSGTVYLDEHGVAQIESSPWPELQDARVPLDITQAVRTGLAGGQVALVQARMFFTGEFYWSLANQVITLELR